MHANLQLQTLRVSPLKNNSSGVQGVIVTGGVGVGKTAIIEQIVDCSIFGQRQTELICTSTYDCGECAYNCLLITNLYVQPS